MSSRVPAGDGGIVGIGEDGEAGVLATLWVMATTLQ